MWEERLRIYGIPEVHNNFPFFSTVLLILWIDIVYVNLIIVKFSSLFSLDNNL